VLKQAPDLKPACYPLLQASPLKKKEDYDLVGNPLFTSTVSTIRKSKDVQT